MDVTELSGLRTAAPRPRIARYGLAVVIVAAATLLRLAVDPLLHDQIPYFIYVAAVVVATWSCGADGGVVATFVAAFAGNYFFVETRYEIVPHPEDLVAMTLFSALALGLVALVGRWKRAETALRERAERLRQLHEEAERANRVKDEFLATLSHELRTPLNAIVGWSQMLLGGNLDPAHERQAVESIARNAEAQTRLVEDVLDVSRIVNGKLRLDVRAVDLDAIVRSALDAVRPAADAKKITLRTSFQCGRLVSGDADRLQQIVWNLLSNAVKFTPPHGWVAVAGGDRGEVVEIRVSDGGVGIAPEFLPHLFERFSQHDSSTTRQQGGLGLGLAIVRHLAELHGGSVKAGSGGADQGSVFTVTLPARAPAEAGERGERPAIAPVEAASTTPSLRGVRVLVVDDETDTVELFRAMLLQIGASVRHATSAHDALSIVRQWQPHVMLADIGMPGEDGYSLIRQVRALPPDHGGLTPAVAVTAYGSNEDRLRAIASGYQVHLPKPTTPEQLATVVAGLAVTHTH